MIYWHKLLKIHLFMELNFGEGDREIGLQGCDILSYTGDSVQTNPLPYLQLASHQLHCTIWARFWAARPKAGIIFLQANLWVVLSWAERKADSRRLSRFLFQASVFKGKWPTWENKIFPRDWGEAEAWGQASPEWRPCPIAAVLRSRLPLLAGKILFCVLIPLHFFHMHYIHGTREKKNHCVENTSLVQFGSPESCGMVSFEKLFLFSKALVAWYRMRDANFVCCLIPKKVSDSLWAFCMRKRKPPMLKQSSSSLYWIKLSASPSTLMNFYVHF